VSQTLTLYVTPVFYIYMEHFQEWLGRRKAARRPTLAHLEKAVGSEDNGV